jgi:hypothetical protein
MISTGICVRFFTKPNLYCHVNSLSLKHANAPKSRSVWASIVASLLHLIMNVTKKHGVESEDRLEPLSLHDASKLNLVVSIETRHVSFSTPMVMHW